MQQLIESDIDKRHRAAQLLLPSGLVIKRPFKIIYPVEIEDGDEKVTEEDNNVKKGV